jgi:hypothetical protein
MSLALQYNRSVHTCTLSCLGVLSQVSASISELFDGFIIADKHPFSQSPFYPIGLQIGDGNAFAHKHKSRTTRLGECYKASKYIVPLTTPLMIEQILTTQGQSSFSYLQG